MRILGISSTPSRHHGANGHLLTDSPLLGIMGKRLSQPPPLPHRQQGAALLVLLTILVLGALTLVVNSLNHNTHWYDRRNAQTTEALTLAKQALLGWAASHPQRPGLLPFPDRNDVDNNYDGASDCPSPVNNTHLLGRLPWSDYPCVDPRAGVDVRVFDAAGEPLWYAVSHNLVYDGGYPAINSFTRDITTDWITVIDNRGNVMSDRVAAVIISPGRVLTGQDRSAAAPGPANYLDSVTIGSTTYNNADFDQVFVAAQRDDSFNDTLIYITIEELLPLLNRRVVREASQCLTAYAAVSNGKFSWAAELDGSAAPDYTGDVDATFGRIPDTPLTDIPGGGGGGGSTPAQCSAALNVLQNPPCTNSPHANPCLNALTTYASCSNCNVIVPPIVNDILTHPPCTNNPGHNACVTANAAQATCSGGGGGPDPDMQTTWEPADCFSSKPYWDDWKEEMLYQIAPGFQPGSSPACPDCLTLDGTSDLHALVISAGIPLTAVSQARNTNAQKGDLTNYLEGENADNDYDFHYQTSNDSFNDWSVCPDGTATCN